MHSFRKLLAVRGTTVETRLWLGTSKHTVRIMGEEATIIVQLKGDDARRLSADFYEEKAKRHQKRSFVGSLPNWPSRSFRLLVEDYA